MKKDLKSNYNGIGFLGLLTILFIGLKLTGHIDCAWWLFLMPLYSLPLVILAIFVIYFVFVKARLVYMLISDFVSGKNEP